MVKKKKVFLLALIFLFSCPFVFSVAPSDLNLFLVNPPSSLNKDLNFGLTWSGSDANVLNWKFASDSNVIVSGGGLAPATTYDDFTGTGGDAWSASKWEVTEDTGAGATKYYEIYDNEGVTSVTRSGSNVEYVVANKADQNITLGVGDSFELEVDLVDSNTTGTGSYALFFVGTSTDITAPDYGIAGWALEEADFGAGTFFGNTKKDVQNPSGKTGKVRVEKVSASDLNITVWLDNNVVVPEETVSDATSTFFFYTWLRQYNSDDTVSLTIDNVKITDSTITLPSPQYQSKTFTTGGTKTIQVTVSNEDGNTSTSLNVTIPQDLTSPTIHVFDLNQTTGFNTTGQVNFKLRCSDTNSTKLDYNVTVNSINQYSANVDSNSVSYDLNNLMVTGNNIYTFTCTDASGNTATDSNIFSGFSGNFYFVYDKTGQTLASSSEYTPADINSVVAYKLNDENVYYDLYANNATSFTFSGIDEQYLGVRIAYNDLTVVTISQSYDVEVLDSNSIPMCFYKLQPYYEQLLYSSVARDVVLRNATNGCYHLAATTRYGSSDFLSLSAYTIPLSYNLLIESSDTNNLTISLDGGSSGSINLDSLILKNNLSQNIVITGDAGTITKSCSTDSDCNTYIITYRNLANNNSQVKLTILKDSSEQLTYTETGNPNNFTYVFDSTNLDFNADVLILRLEKTKTNGDVFTENIYFTPQGTVGFFDPTLAIIFSFFLFIGGITLVSTRFLFGWFGLVVALVGLALLTFSLSLWYVTFLQGVMLMMLIYMGINAIKREGVL